MSTYGTSILTAWDVAQSVEEVSFISHSYKLNVVFFGRSVFGAATEILWHDLSVLGVLDFSDTLLCFFNPLTLQCRRI